MLKDLKDGEFAELWADTRRDLEPLAGFAVALIVLGIVSLVAGKEFVKPLLLILTSVFSTWLALGVRRRADVQPRHHDPLSEIDDWPPHRSF